MNTTFKFRISEEKLAEFKECASLEGITLAAWIISKCESVVPTASVPTPTVPTQQPSESATISDVPTNEGTKNTAKTKLKCNPAMDKFLDTNPVKEKVKIPDWIGSGLDDNKSDSRSGQVKCLLKK